MQVKTCLTCNKNKDILDFYKHRAKCKDCLKLQREANKDSIKEYKKQYRLLNKNKINEYKIEYRKKNKNYGKYRHAPEYCVVYNEGGDLCPDCDPTGCKGVIPNTFIMCGEAGQYCSNECMMRANDNKKL